MAFEYGGRFNTGDYFSTKIDIDNETAETQGTIDGIPVEFSGSSDFSTATVTLNNPLSNLASIVNIPNALNDESSTGALTTVWVDYNSSVEVSVILYQGHAEATFASSDIDSGFHFASATGEVEIDADYNDIAYITGDGTLTIGKN